MLAVVTLAVATLAGASLAGAWGTPAVAMLLVQCWPRGIGTSACGDTGSCTGHSGGGDAGSVDAAVVMLAVAWDTPAVVMLAVVTLAVATLAGASLAGAWGTPAVAMLLVQCWPRYKAKVRTLGTPAVATWAEGQN
ncbi:UNVERIFIED_CONTAM: hypothetical protein FKN15_067517 [Acipenser sinensis]